MDVMMRRRELMAVQTKEKSKNLLPITNLSYNEFIAHGGYQSDNTTILLFVTGLIPGETYTLSCSINEVLQSSSQNRFYLRGVSNTFINLTQETVPVRKSVSRVCSESGRIAVSINKNFSLDPERCAAITQLQLERGDTMTSYEPYY